MNSSYQNSNWKSSRLPTIGILYKSWNEKKEIWLGILIVFSNYIPIHKVVINFKPFVKNEQKKLSSEDYRIAHGLALSEEILILSHLFYFKPQ